MTKQSTAREDSGQRPDFTIVFTKLKEHAEANPELAVELKAISEEASSIEELRRVAATIACPTPQTLTLS